MRPEDFVRRENAEVNAPIGDGHELVRCVRDAVQDDATGGVRSFTRDGDNLPRVDDAAEHVGHVTRGDDLRARGDDVT